MKLYVNCYTHTHTLLYKTLFTVSSNHHFKIFMNIDIHQEVGVHCGKFLHDFEYFEKLYDEHRKDVDIIKIIISQVRITNFFFLVLC